MVMFSDMELACIASSSRNLSFCDLYKSSSTTHLCLQPLFPISSMLSRLRDGQHLPANLTCLLKAITTIWINSAPNWRCVTLLVLVCGSCLDSSVISWSGEHSQRFLWFFCRFCHTCIAARVAPLFLALESHKSFGFLWSNPRESGMPDLPC